MSSSSALILIATLLSTDGSSAQIELDDPSALEPGDRGRVYYELLVNGEPRRIDVGGVGVTQVRDRSATLTTTDGSDLRTGYQVEFALPIERLRAPAEPARAQRERVERPPRDEPREVPEAVLPGTVLIEVEEAPTTESEVDSVVSEVESVTAGMAFIPGGSYTVGLDVSEATFVNETPRHSVDLAAFWIDMHPAAGKGAEYSDVFRGMTLADAQAYCAEYGKRLPTEAEWEVAVGQGMVELRVGLYEWTSSWYQAYPGNERQEEQFGEKFKVIRGGSEETGSDPHARRFLAPGKRNTRLGFRCARDAG